MSFINYIRIPFSSEDIDNEDKNYKRKIKIVNEWGEDTISHKLLENQVNENKNNI